jgi:hypothetical protein
MTDARRPWARTSPRATDIAIWKSLLHVEFDGEIASRGSEQKDKLAMTNLNEIMSQLGLGNRSHSSSRIERTILYKKTNRKSVSFFIYFSLTID